MDGSPAVFISYGSLVFLIPPADVVVVVLDVVDGFTVEV